VKNKRFIFAFVPMALLIGVPSVTWGDDKATPQEVVAKLKEAASTLSKGGDVAQFNQKQSPWVWKDTYVFVQDCDKNTVAAHPLRADLRGQPLSAVKDAQGKGLYSDPAKHCAAARKPSGLWQEYMWAKPGEKEATRKVSYYLAAKGTPYVVGAGVYDDKASIAELSKLTTAR
jgi:hypothetical protein